MWLQSFYFLLGVTGSLPSLNVLFSYRAFHVQPGDLELFQSIIALPWLIKPIYAWVSDSFPLWGYRRKPYMFIFSLYAASGYVAAPIVTDSVWIFTLILTWSSFALCVSDVVTDALVVEYVKEHEKGKTEDHGKLLSSCRMSRVAGHITGSVISSCVFYSMGNTGEPIPLLFYITAVFPCLVTITALNVKERPILVIPSVTQTSFWEKYHPRKALNYAKRFFGAFVAGGLWRIAVPVTAYMILPDPDAGYIYLYQDQLGLNGLELSIVSIVELFGNLSGLSFYRFYVRKLPQKHVIAFNIALVGVQLILHAYIMQYAPTPLRIVFVYITSFVQSFNGALVFQPLLSMAAENSPDGEEGSFYATLVSIENFGGVVSQMLSATLLSISQVKEGQYEGLLYASWASAVLYLIPAFLVYVVHHHVQTSV